jgi:hypothetical protein
MAFLNELCHNMAKKFKVCAVKNGRLFEIGMFIIIFLLFFYLKLFQQSCLFFTANAVFYQTRGFIFFKCFK